MADRVVAGLLAQTTAGADFADTAKKVGAAPIRTGNCGAAGNGAGTLRVRLSLGGLLLWVTTALLQPGVANRQEAWPRRFGFVSGACHSGHSRRQKSGPGA